MLPSVDVRRFAVGICLCSFYRTYVSGFDFGSFSRRLRYGRWCQGGSSSISATVLFFWLDLMFLLCLRPCCVGYLLRFPPRRNPCACPALSLRFPCAVGIGVGFVLFRRLFCFNLEVFVFFWKFFRFCLFFGPFPLRFSLRDPCSPLRFPALALRSPIFSQISGSNFCPEKLKRAEKKEHDLGKKGTRLSSFSA